MARFSGTVSRSDLEGGVTQLTTADGTTYELQGTVGEEWFGKAVIVEGTIDRAVLSFTMTGPRLIVKSIKAAS